VIGIEAGLLTIDLDAIAANYRLLQDKAGSAVCAAVVKADAYGLGMEKVAPALAQAGCRTFFVATLEEGVALRSVLKDAAIHVFNGVPSGGGGDFAEHKLTPVLNSLGDIEAWAAYCKQAGQALAAGVHVDTGMSRLGLPAYELQTLAAEPQRLEGVKPAYVMSHLACANEANNDMNRRQLEKFAQALESLAASPASHCASLANSSGIFLGGDYHFQMVRPGSALYGVSPLSQGPNPMAQVARLQGKILQIREIDTPLTVGYGATRKVAPGERIATVAIGYADGYPRSLSNSGCGFIGSYKAPVIGRVSMDLITLDVTKIPSDSVHPGTMVDLIGPHNPVDDVAKRAGTIGYEILTSLGARYQRAYVGAKV